MKLLFLTSQKIWPLTSGNRLRNYHLARQLGALGSVTLVELCYENEEPSNPPDDCKFDRIISLHKSTGYTPIKLIRGMAGPTALTLLNYFEPRLAAQLADILDRGQFDAVHLGGFHLSSYLSVAETACPAVLLDWHNIESELMRRYSENTGSWPKRLAAKRTATLLERSELRLLQKCRIHTAASERERDKLLARYPSATVHVIPNGVDTQYFSKIGAAQSAAPFASERNLLFVGSMDYHANIDAVTSFVREIWPDIAANLPNLKFVIVGRDPAPEVLKLASDRILVTGTVDDVRPYYRSALAVIVPLRVGGGTRLKILEAMAAGVPIVSTTLGAEGLGVTNGVHLLISNSSAEMIAAVNQLSASSELRTRLVTNARDQVIARYDWSVVGDKLHSIYKELLMAPSR